MNDEVTIEKAGAHIKLTGRLDYRTNQIAERVSGGRFANPAWAYPLTMSACHELRRAFGARLRIGPELRAWATEQIGREATLGDLAVASDAELNYVNERIDKATAERSYQRVAARFITEAGSCLIADQPGLGKCLELLAGVQEANPSAETRYHLIFAPSIAVSAVWPGETEHWCGLDAVAYPITGTAEQRHLKLAHALTTGGLSHGIDVFVICNIEMAQIKPVENRKGKKEFHVENARFPELFDREWDTIVCDESHRALIKSGGKTQVREGLTRLHARQRIALSGTPMRGKPVYLWGTLNWLRPDLYPSFWSWVEQYWEIFKTRYSQFNIGNFLPDGETRLANDLRSIMLRRTKAEVLPQLPPKQYAGTYLDPDDDQSPLGVWLEMTPDQTVRYEKFVAEGTVKLPGYGPSPAAWLIANGTLAERTRKLQLASSTGRMDGEDYRPALPSPKFDWLVLFLSKLGLCDRPQRGVSYSKAQRKATPEDDNRVIVSSHSTALLNLFADELGKFDVDCHLLTGETRTADRATMAADFQSTDPRKRVFLLNAKAGGVALTLDMADYLVMLDESTIPDDDEQVEDRAHRTSRLHQLTIYKLRMLGTIEEEVAWIAAAAEDVQKYILDGARGVEYARQHYRETRKTDE